MATQEGTGPSRGEELPVTVAQDVLAALQAAAESAAAAADPAPLLACFAPDAVLIGTAGHAVNAGALAAYLQRIAQTGTIRWQWEQVLVTHSSPSAVGVAAFGSVGWDGKPDRDPIRLTLLVVPHDGAWRIASFHGSLPAS